MPCSGARRSISRKTGPYYTLPFALRKEYPSLSMGEALCLKIHVVLDKMSDFCNRVRTGAWKGEEHPECRQHRHCGSDLGPVMAYEALRYYSKRDMTFYFISNVDGTDFAEAVRDLDPGETLIIVSSKTFTTLGDYDQRLRRSRLGAGGPGNHSWLCDRGRSRGKRLWLLLPADTRNSWTFSKKRPLPPHEFGEYHERGIACARE